MRAKIKHYLRAGAISMTLIVIISGCKTTPSNAFVRAQDDAHLRLQQNINRIAIIADACVVMDPTITKSYIDLERSKKAEKHMLDYSRSYLNVEKACEIKFVKSPYVGAYKNPEMVFRIKPESGKIKNLKPPFCCNEEINDPEFRKAVISINREVLRCVQTKIKKQGDVVPVPVKMTNEISKVCCVLQKAMDVDYLVVIIGNGTHVPFIHSFSQAMTTGLITGILTMGMVTVSTRDVSFFDTYTGIVDLNKAEIVWSNSLRHTGINSAGEGFYKNIWDTAIFYHLPGREVIRE